MVMLSVLVREEEMHLLIISVAYSGVRLYKDVIILSM